MMTARTRTRPPAKQPQDDRPEMAIRPMMGTWGTWESVHSVDNTSLHRTSFVRNTMSKCVSACRTGPYGHSRHPSRLSSQVRIEDGLGFSLVNFMSSHIHTAAMRM